eukprot:1038743-Prorocentrum_minimum.AAC.1
MACDEAALAAEPFGLAVDVLVSFPTWWNWWEEPVNRLELFVERGALLDMAGNPSRLSNTVTEVLDQRAPTGRLRHLPDLEVRPGKKVTDNQYLEAEFSEDVLLTESALQVRFLPPPAPLRTPLVDPLQSPSNSAHTCCSPSGLS